MPSRKNISFLFFSFTHFEHLVSFYKPSRNLRYSDIFRGYRKRTVLWNRLSFDWQLPIALVKFSMETMFCYRQIKTMVSIILHQILKNRKINLQWNQWVANMGSFSPCRCFSFKITQMKILSQFLRNCKPHRVTVSVTFGVALLIIAPSSRKFLNPLTTSVSHHIETSKLICRANQLTGFYMMCNIGR